MKTLTVDQARTFYDRFGSKQDSQAFYEDAALDDLVAYAGFGLSRHVFELGCGTGRLAERLLNAECPTDTTYEGVDISTTMIDLARERLRRFGQRASVRRIEGGDPFAGMLDRPDRIVTTYVIDLFPDAEIARFIDAAATALAPGGRLCIASLTFGNDLLSRFVTAGWRGLFRLSPRIVGGCRPIRLVPLLSNGAWKLVYHRVVTSFAIASEIVIAEI